MDGEQGGSRAGSLAALAERFLAVRGSPPDFWRAFDESLVPMLLLDGERRVVDSNHAAQLLFRLNLRELRGLTLDRWLESGSEFAGRREWQEAVQGRSSIGRMELLLDDGFRLAALYRVLAGVIPGEFLLALSPARWSDHDWATVRHRSPIRPSARLSDRETEVLAFAANGLTANEIARALGLQPATVRTHLGHTMRKLGARNRAHAVALAIQGSVDGVRRDELIQA